MDSLNHIFAPQAPKPASWGDKLRNSKALLPTLAVLGVTTLALAATLASHRIVAQDAIPEATVAAVATPMMVPLTSKEGARDSAKDSGSTAVPQRQASARCGNCGVVHSVTPVQRQGRVDGIGNSGIGVGAVAGGVIGGLLGNQVGGGSGKTAATVLGAAGGAYAGHSIEKNSKKYTAYQVRVRMSDGSYRTVEQSTPVATGAQVRVDGNAVRLLPLSTSHGGSLTRMG